MFERETSTFGRLNSVKRGFATVWTGESLTTSVRRDGWKEINIKFNCEGSTTLQGRFMNRRVVLNLCDATICNAPRRVTVASLGKPRRVKRVRALPPTPTACRLKVDSYVLPARARLL